LTASPSLSTDCQTMTKLWATRSRKTHQLAKRASREGAPRAAGEPTRPLAVVRLEAAKLGFKPRDTYHVLMFSFFRLLSFSHLLVIHLKCFLLSIKWAPPRLDSMSAYKATCVQSRKCMRYVVMLSKILPAGALRLVKSGVRNPAAHCRCCGANRSTWGHFGVKRRDC
jgi:hypothetical protein